MGVAAFMPPSGRLSHPVFFQQQFDNPVCHTVAFAQGLGLIEFDITVEPAGNAAFEEAVMQAIELV